MKTQQIKRKDLAKIYSQVGTTWQKTIADLLIEQIDKEVLEIVNQ